MLIILKIQHCRYRAITYYSLNRPWSIRNVFKWIKYHLTVNS